MSCATDKPDRSAETADDAVLRFRLARLAEASGLPAPEGHVAVRRSAIVDAGLDPLTAWVWIEQHGGEEKSTYIAPPRKHLLDEPREPLQPEPYFVLPASAFEE